MADCARKNSSGARPALSAISDGNSAMSSSGGDSCSDVAPVLRRRYCVSSSGDGSLARKGGESSSK